MELVAHIEKACGVRVADNEPLPQGLELIDAITLFLERKRAGLFPNHPVGV